MTKCTVFNPEKDIEIKAEKKPIEFLYVITNYDSIEETVIHPSDWENIVLIQKDSCGFDVMLAYDNDPQLGRIYTGHWNDGVAE